MEKQPISREGYEKLREEIRQLEDVELPRVAQLVADARAEGDLRENAEYHGQREAQGLLQAKSNQLKARLANCYIIDRTNQPKGVVVFGSQVTVKNRDDGDIEQYQLVGPGEEDYMADVMKILTTSPVGTALMGKKVGDQAEVPVPRGVLRYEITEITDPTV